MLTLGDILARARQASPVLEAWLDRADPELALQVRTAATRLDLSPASFARSAIADFDRYAEPEAWTRLTGRLHDSQDPGLICVQEMVRWRLAHQLDAFSEIS